MDNPILSRKRLLVNLFCPENIIRCRICLHEKSIKFDAGGGESPTFAGIFRG